VMGPQLVGIDRRYYGDVGLQALLGLIEPCGNGFALDAADATYLERARAIVTCQSSLIRK
jgi:hypothetical protein